MTPRAAAVAFAASALVATPALADSGKGYKHDYGKSHVSTAVQLDFGKGFAVTLASSDFSRGRTFRHSKYGYGNYGYQSNYRTRQLRRQAVRLCEQAVSHRSYRNGFKYVELDDVERIRQIGPQGFVVRAEFDFKGYRRGFEKDVTCTVRRGKVVDINDLPRPIGHRHASHGHSGPDFHQDGNRNTGILSGGNGRQRGR